MVGLKKKVTYAKISPTMVNTRDITGNVEEEEEDEKKYTFFKQPVYVCMYVQVQVQVQNTLLSGQRNLPVMPQYNSKQHI